MENTLLENALLESTLLESTLLENTQGDTSYTSCKFSHQVVPLALAPNLVGVVHK